MLFPLRNGFGRPRIPAIRWRWKHDCWHSARPTGKWEKFICRNGTSVVEFHSSGPKSNGNLTPTDLNFGPQTSISLILYIGQGCIKLTILFYCVTFMRFHDGITFERIKLEVWNLLQSTSYPKLLLGRNRHDCQIISLACVIVIFNIVLQKPEIS